MKRILIVEDDAEIRESLQDMLTIKGYQTITAQDGKEGLFLASTEKPDLILSDIMMPEMNGFDLLSLIQNNCDMATIPFIFLTAKMEPINIRKGMNLGADDYLFKPIRSQELIAAIEKRLEKANAIKIQYDKEYKKILTELNLSASHEFNTPLNGILGFVDMISRSPSISPQKLVSFMEIIRESGLRLKDTLDNLLLYRSIVSGAKIYNKDTLMLQFSLIEELAHEIAMKYDREADLVITKQHEITLICDIMHFQKILKELIDNAFKFSKIGDKVNITVAFTNKHYLISISDQGRGLRPEQIANIAAFKQFDRKLYEQQGLGLGLFLSHELAKRNNWELEICQNEKNGLTCNLYI